MEVPGAAVTTTTITTTTTTAAAATSSAAAGSIPTPTSSSTTTLAQHETKDRNANDLVSSPFGDSIDADIFDQILEMDDDEDREFSRSIVFGFFEQAEETFRDMELHLKLKDLPKLSALGHFLKGSSATLGMVKVKEGCAKIQHLGQLKDETGTVDVPDEALCLKRIEDTLQKVREEYRTANTALEKYYEENKLKG